MVSFKCPDCQKISAYPIEIINDIYEATKKEPQDDCYHCKNHNFSPITTNPLTEKYLKTKLQKNHIFEEYWLCLIFLYSKNELWRNFL